MTTTGSDAPVAPGDSVALSTQPLPPPPPPVGRRSPLQVARRGWRVLTSMRTALLLLVLLGLAAIPGSLIPQHSLAPSTVLRFQTDHPTLSKVYDKFDLFDVFHAPWFAAIYLLLFVSLVGCVIPRTRLHLRAMLRKPPSAPRNLGRLPQSARWETDLPPDRAVELAAKALRRKRFRVAVGESSVAAEKGYLRETGNLLFHLSLILLLAGIGTGSLFGYSGSVLLVDGHSFTNVAALYDTYKPGALTSSTSLSPFSVHLNGFDATYQANGEPETFDAHVVATTAGGKTTTDDLRVNHPLTFGHARVYLIGHGYTLHVVLRSKSGQVTYENDVPCIPQDLTDYLSDCVVKAPNNTPSTIPTTFTDPQSGEKAVVDEPLQFAFLLDFVPTAADVPGSGVISTYPAPDRPRVIVQAYTGDLGYGTGVPQSVYDVDTSTLNAVPTCPTGVQPTAATPCIPARDEVLTPGGAKTGAIETVPLPDGYTLDVTGYGQWASLQVKDDPAKGLTLVAAGLIVLGLLLSLRVRRRRVWLRATPSASGRTIVEAGGLARTDADDFAREFPRLVAGMAAAVRPSESS